MGDPPFDLSKFDPSSLELSHLHPADQNRIRNRQFNSQELSLLLSGQNPWTESGRPKPLPPQQQSKEPTLDDLRRICHADTLPLLERGDPGVRAALEAQWKAANPQPLPPEEDEKPRASFTDDDRNFPLPHENRSFITGAKRRITSLSIPTVDPVPESPETDDKPSAEIKEDYWNKFWKLGESNVFMGGGVGVALAALAFLIGGAPRFAIILLFFAWLIISVSIYKHRFFEGKSRRAQALWNAVACFAVALIMAVSWFLMIPSAKSTANNNPDSQSKTEEVPVFLAEKYPAFGTTKTFTFFGDKHFGALSFQARFGFDNDLMIILVTHSTDTDTRYLAGGCLAAINNYQAIVDELKSEIRKGQTEVIALEVYPTLICHYDQATDIPQEKIDALKRIALIKHLVLRIEGPNGPK